MSSLKVKLCAALGCALTAVGAGAAPLGTNFTYQGKLQDNGVAADGVFDVRFRLFDAGNAGVQIGSTVCVDSVIVSNGLFTASVDFGAAAFSGDARWLEVSVREDATPANCGAGAYTVLSGRQPLTIAPYALYALNGGHWDRANATLTNESGTNFVGINRNTRVTGAEYFGIQAPVNSGYGGMYIRTDGATALPFYGFSAGTETCWTYMDGSSGNWHVFADGDRLTVTDDGDVGISTISPVARLHVTDGTDSAPAGGGFIVSGDVAGPNISIDNNEIMARDNAATSTLYLNNNGGAVFVGDILQVDSSETTHKAVIEHSTNNTLRLIGPGATYGFNNAINFGDAEYVYLWEDSDDNLTIHAVGGVGGRLRVQADTIVWNATKPATVKLDDQTQVRMYAEEATQVMFTDYGRGRLVDGVARIALDAEFGQTVTINDEHPMSVFVQLEGDCNGVFVANMSAAGFEVRELQGGRSGAAFSYRVVAQRKLYENLRMATEEEDKAANRRMRQVMWPEEITPQTYADKPVSPQSPTPAAQPGSTPVEPQQQAMASTASGQS
ncbi:MAG: hypothetical protein JNG88_13985 [Phycisphaerales bacterium]|nr:hypothetical protein [Phycisphaerales bacterium]